MNEHQRHVKARESILRGETPEKRIIVSFEDPKEKKEREKQIERVVLNTSGMYGDIRGIAGASVQQIEELELDAGDGEVSVGESVE